MCGGARSPVPGILTARTLYARHCPSQPVHQQPVAGRLYLEGFLPWRQCSCTRWCHRRIRLTVFQGEDGPQRRSCTGERGSALICCLGAHQTKSKGRGGRLSTHEDSDFSVTEIAPQPVVDTSLYTVLRSFVEDPSM